MSSLKKSIINKQEQQHIETTVAYIARWGLPAVFRKSVWKNRSGQKTGNLVNTKAARKKNAQPRKVLKQGIKYSRALRGAVSSKSGC